MNWLFLVLAGLLEVGWAVGLKYTEGFTRPLPSVLTVIAMVVGFYLLSLSMREIPLGTAYGIWVGIGAAGAAIAGMVLFKEPVSTLRIASIVLVVAGIVGLKLSSAS
ncbi:QacE family quaternary ammonium compound efflux SMR transporter [Arenimonas soli]|uniref:Guanidinium exporter n=1 Tax=Arenimonas soli TaxID=2269504 RepID=A0ABQ1HIE7_9GAMM|nr:quaternary ammonium compound efflux SMR transporter SugE [Arenimonas soli]GGA77527.1 QacE family quaternary ammonium compound efflux SMR transporter [Arenimonas soli]